MQAWMAPMLATAIPGIPTSGDWIAEPKFDGWRFLVHVTDHGCVAIAGRNGSDYSGKLPYIERALAKALPVDSCVDGELVGTAWGDVQSVMAANGPHIPHAAGSGLQLMIFDVLRCAGNDTRKLPWHERRQILDAATFTDPLHLTDVFPATPRTYQVAVELGFEGVVCKRTDSVYVNTRSASWGKVKASETVDARVIGWERGTGSNADRLGALTVALEDGTRVKVGGGFTDAVREEFRGLVPQPSNPAYNDQWPTGWEHATIEIVHNGKTANSVRHPRFVRRRDDKTLVPPHTVGGHAVKAHVRTRTPKVGAWVRNYGAMGDAKLIDVVHQLHEAIELGVTNDAAQRVAQNGGDLKHNFNRARDAARSKGLLP